MIRSDEDWLATIDAFHSAAVGAQSWETALERFADATGSRTGQLTGVDRNASVLFNVFTNFDPIALTMFPATAAINPRVKAANETQVLEVIAEDDFITPERCLRDPFYQEVAFKLDAPFICMTSLVREEGSSIVLAAVRSQREGHITREQRAIFASLALHVRSAVRTHLALEGHGTAVLHGAMEALAIPVFICDRAGRVQSLTQSAEALVTDGRGLQLKAGHLQAYDPNDSRSLNDAVGAAAIGYAPGPPVLRTVIVRGRDRERPPVVLDVSPLPAQPYQLSFLPRVLIVARGVGGSSARRAMVLRTVYALTTAETEIAEYLAEGLSAESIAAKRGAAVGTVRGQIKAIMGKVGVSRQAELVARLGQL
ncbi:MAG: helix-turn-helix transcriptional regulator [Steroidobacteraceae bacterium]